MSARARTSRSSSSPSSSATSSASRARSCNDPTKPDGTPRKLMSSERLATSAGNHASRCARAWSRPIAGSSKTGAEKVRAGLANVVADSQHAEHADRPQYRGQHEHDPDVEPAPWIGRLLGNARLSVDRQIVLRANRLAASAGQVRRARRCRLSPRTPDSSRVPGSAQRHLPGRRARPPETLAALGVCPRNGPAAAVADAVCLPSAPETCPWIRLISPVRASMRDLSIWTEGASSDKYPETDARSDISFERSPSSCASNSSAAVAV